MKLENFGIFNQFAFDYSDNNREILKSFKNYHYMLEYLKTQPILYDIISYAESNGIKRRSNLIAKSSTNILTTTYACILRNFFGDEAFYPVFMNNDPMIKRAIAAIHMEYAYPQAVATMKYRDNP
jgi:carboxyl-terminal processing protease